MNTILIRILNRLGIIDYFNTTGKVKINESVYKIPVIGRLGFFNLGGWESWMVSLLKIVVQIKREQFVDIGANIGQTLLNIKSVSPEIKYIGFDPNPACNFYLNELVRRNRLQQVKIIPTGISTEDGVNELVLYNERQTDGAASMIKDFRPGNKIYFRKYVPVFQVKTLRSWIDFGQMSILKIDVEGAELEVLTSFYDEIKQHQPIILMEILPVYRAEMHERLKRQKAIEKILRELDYTIYKILKNERMLIGAMKIQEIGIHSNLNECEYVFVHHSDITQFESILQENYELRS